ncbi:MAG: winged helix-turn-helix domain-containing tetratricopeptide repeat protein [Terriglobia bacterium]
MVQPGTVFHFGLFEVDLQAGELRKKGQKVRLQEQPFQILAALLERPGQVVSRDDLRRRLWPDDTFVEFDHSLNTAIGRLRDALDDSADNPRFIETLPRRGYRFIAPVERSNGDASAQLGEQRLAAAHVAASLPASTQPPNTWQIGMAALVLVAAIGAGLYLLRRHSSAPLSTGQHKIMLAVLPFQNLSGDPKQDFASDAMTEEMITHLGRLAPQALGVIARTSIMKYKKSTADVRAIGRDLGVGYVLEGSVRRGAGQIDITAQLIQTGDQTHLWAESYERPLTDVFTIERDIARHIAQSLTLRLLPDREAALARATTVDTEAYQAYIEGSQHLSEGTETGFQNAVASFGRATTIDPNYALAYDGIARAYLQDADYHFMSSDQALARARPAVDKALALDESIPESHVVLAEALHFADPHQPGIESAYRRALELNPSNADAHVAYALYLRETQRFDPALTEAEEALRLDPLAPFAHVVTGWVLLSMQRREEAVRQFGQSLDLDPNYPAGLYFLSRAYVEQGRLKDAIGLLQKAIASAGRKPKYLYALANLYVQAGKKDEAQKILDELRQQAATGYVEPSMIPTLAAKLKG